jgi:glycosyltransferase involved in cell wall biosynthesis
MKIAIDLHSLGSGAGGNETFCQQLLRALALDKSGNQYTLLYAHRGIPESNPLGARFRWVAIPRNWLQRVVVSLPQILRKERPDVFHCQYVRPPFLTCRTVVSIYDLAHEHYPEYQHTVEAVAMRRLVRAAARRADRIITISQFCADDISRTYQVPRERISVAYPAVCERFRPGDKELAREQLARKYAIEANFLLYVGRIQARKNLVRLVEAFHRLRQRGASVKLVIVGKLDYGADQLLAKVDELGLRNEVVFPGYVVTGDLPLFYHAAELFIFPSLFEGFGLPVLEGIASGVPVITSQGSALEEVAGDSALIIDPNDTSSMMAAMEKVLNNAELRRDLVARGLRRSAEFTVQKFAAKVLEVYNAVATS